MKFHFPVTIRKKLQAIRRLFHLSQRALAEQFNVSVVTVNRWINGEVVPRRMAAERIEALYQYTGLTVIPKDALDGKKSVLLRRAGKEKPVLHTILSRPDLRDAFVLVLTYTSNAIEGSTLTEAETAAVLFQTPPLPDKTFIEKLEAKNHQSALLFLFAHLEAGNRLDDDLLRRLHRLLLNGIRSDAGSYRRHGVRFVGADIPTANYLTVPALMEELVRDLRTPTGDGIEHAAAIHARFEKIHPFSDGNGRMGRLLLHAMLLRHNLPPVVLRPEKRRFYYAALHAAQKTGDTALLQDFLCNGIQEGWEMLEA